MTNRDARERLARDLADDERAYPGRSFILVPKDDLRALLLDQPLPSGEPVAWRWRKKGSDFPWATGTSPVEGPGASDFYETQPLFLTQTKGGE